MNEEWAGPKKWEEGEIKQEGTFSKCKGEESSGIAREKNDSENYVCRDREGLFNHALNC